jgi:hypothetical protein
VRRKKNGSYYIVGMKAVLPKRYKYLNCNKRKYLSVGEENTVPAGKLKLMEGKIQVHEDV